MSRLRAPFTFSRWNVYYVNYKSYAHCFISLLYRHHIQGHDQRAMLILYSLQWLVTSFILSFMLMDRPRSTPGLAQFPCLRRSWPSDPTPAGPGMLTVLPILPSPQARMELPHYIFRPSILKTVLPQPHTISRVCRSFEFSLPYHHRRAIFLLLDPHSATYI